MEGERGAEIILICEPPPPAPLPLPELAPSPRVDRTAVGCCVEWKSFSSEYTPRTQSPGSMPSRPIWGDRAGGGFLPPSSARDIKKNNLRGAGVSHLEGGIIDYMGNFSPGWGPRKVGFLPGAGSAVEL